MKLESGVKEILKPWYPDLDLDKVKIVQGGMITWFFGKFFNAASVTIGSGWTICLTQKSYWEPKDPYNHFGLSLLVHELKHIEQQQEMGSPRFYLKYLFDLMRAGFKYSDKLPLEAPAHEIEKKFLRGA